MTAAACQYAAMRVLPVLVGLLWAGNASAQALQTVPEGARVLHCVLSRGVLTLLYVQGGQTASAPAFHTAAIYRACALAGHALPDGPQRRGAWPAPVQRIAIAPPLPRAGAPGDAAGPGFSVLSGGGALAIDGRNDSDIDYHCVLHVEWAADGGPGGTRAARATAALPPRQSMRVLSLPAPGGGARLVGLPRWNCRPG
jgi:hypothetical protein